MAFFPQLDSGAAAQYPAVKRHIRRTVTNEAPDGTLVKLGDADAAIVEWELRYEALTEDEMETLRAFFESMEGRMGSFAFADPVGNLLAWSESPDQSVWQKDPLLTLHSGAEDPHGGTRAWYVENSGQAAQRLLQTLETPPGLYCCLSVYLRSPDAQTVRLLRGTLSSECVTSAAWRRFQLAGTEEGPGDTTAFGIELPAGGAVEAFGFQVEAQIGSSGYKRTTTQGGIYAKARFGDDVLKFTCTDVGQYQCGLRIIHANYF